MKQLIPKKFHENYPSEFPPKGQKSGTISEQIEQPHKRARTGQTEGIDTGTKRKRTVKISRDVVVLTQYKKKPTFSIPYKKRYVN